MIPLPLNKKAALAQPPKIEVLMLCSTQSDFGDKIIIFSEGWDQWIHVITSF
jgi:hypothetical protein